MRPLKKLNMERLLFIAMFSGDRGRVAVSQLFYSHKQDRTGGWIIDLNGTCHLQALGVAAH